MATAELDVDGHPRAVAGAGAAVLEAPLHDRLRSVAGDDAVVLVDRRVPGTLDVIDVLVVGRTGVWVVAERAAEASVELRPGRVGAERGPQLYVDGANRTAFAVDLEWQVSSVRRLLEPIGLGGVPVTPALCFDDASWAGAEARSFEIGPVLVTDADHLRAVVGGVPTLVERAVEAVSAQLRAELPDV